MGHCKQPIGYQLCIHTYRVLTATDVALERKKPFARLLTEAYLNSDKDSTCATLTKQE